MRDRSWWMAAIVAVTTSLMFAQQPPSKVEPPPARSVAPPVAKELEMNLKPTFPGITPELEKLLEAKVTAEWEAIKARDKEAFTKLLTDDFIAVEDDAEGARNRFKAANEISASMVHHYTLERMKAFPLGPDVTFVKYESTMGFPATAIYRYKRVWISEIWVRQGADWKLWRYQETRVK